MDLALLANLIDLLVLGVPYVLLIRLIWLACKALKKYISS